MSGQVSTKHPQAERRRLRILFVNHTGEFSGAEDSMTRLVEGIRATDEVAIACPSSGPLAEEVRSRGITHLPIPPTSASFQLHPTRTLAGLVQLTAQGFAVRRAARTFRADLVHANSPRAGLSAALAARPGAPPVVVRIHDNLPEGLMARAVRRVVAGGASDLIAVSKRTAQIFAQGLGTRRVSVVYPSINHARFDPRILDGNAVRNELRLGSEARLLGMVAQITPWKRQDLAIRVLGSLRRSGTDAHLALVGSVSFRSLRYDNDRYASELRDLARSLELDEYVHFLGQRRDVASIVSAMDVSLLPSENDAFPLVIPESMAAGTPVITVATGSGGEIIRDGETGLLVEGWDTETWARACNDLLRDPVRLAGISEACPGAVAWLTDEAHVAEIARIHHRVTRSEAGRL